MRSFEPSNNDIEKARKFLVRMWQSFGPKTAGSNPGWGRSKKITGPNRPYQWSKVPKIIIKFSERLKNIQIENCDVFDLISEYDYPGNFIYLDPPYLINTRNSKSRVYKYEFEREDHEKLLRIINKIKYAKVMISSYENNLYNKYLRSWNKENFDSYSLGGTFKKEIIYMNYNNQNKLF
jgi:DNA adenine methylase